MTVSIPPTLFHLAGDRSVVEVDGSNVGNCLMALTNMFPQLRAELFGADGQLEKNVEVYVNLKSTYPDGLAKTVEIGDEIQIIEMVAGG